VIKEWNEDLTVTFAAAAAKGMRARAVRIGRNISGVALKGNSSESKIIS